MMPFTLESEETAQDRTEDRMTQVSHHVLNHEWIESGVVFPIILPEG
jgi:hypothetical protein